jgi:hypothetical protein
MVIPEARSNKYNAAVFKITMNTPLRTIFSPIRLPSLINVPEGYELVQDGMKFEFVKIDEPLTGWMGKEDTVSGYYVDGVSDIGVADSHPRDDFISPFFLFFK